MNSLIRVAFCLFAVALLAGCASTKVTGSQNIPAGTLARPGRIIVHDFAATPGDIPAWSAAAVRHAQSETSNTPEEIEVGRELGAQVAQRLVEEIKDMGMPAVRAMGQREPDVDDIVIIGYFESIEEGSAAERVIVGFGAGGAELSTQVEGYLMTNQGLRKLGSREVASGAGKTPGVAVPLAVTIATKNPIGLVVGGAMKVGGEVSGSSTVEGSAKRTAKKIAEELEVAFQRQGWI